MLTRTSARRSRWRHRFVNLAPETKNPDLSSSRCSEGHKNTDTQGKLHLNNAMASSLRGGKRIKDISTGLALVAPEFFVVKYSCSKCNHLLCRSHSCTSKITTMKYGNKTEKISKNFGNLTEVNTRKCLWSA